MKKLQIYRFLLLSSIYRFANDFYNKGDNENALKYLEISAKGNGNGNGNGNAQAQYQLAMMYYEGKGTEQSFELALQWLKKSAKQGHPLAQYKLAMMYYSGKGTKQNAELALQWLEKADEVGHPLAHNSLLTLRCHSNFIKQ